MSKRVIALSLFTIVLLIGLTSGFAVLSISRVDFLSYDEILKDRAWVIHASLDGQDQRIAGTFPANEINKKVRTGEKVENDFQISMQLDEFTCEYPIRAQDEYVWDYDYEKAEFVFGLGAKEFLEDCKASHPDWRVSGQGNCWNVVVYGIILETKCDWYCVWRTEKARYGRILDPRTHFKATISLSSDGDSKSTIIDSHSAETATLDRIGHIRWGGYLGTDEECPTATAEGLVSMYYSGFVGPSPGGQLQWVLTDADKLDSYKTFSMKDCFANVQTGKFDMDEDCIQQHDVLADKAMLPKRFSFYMADIEETTAAKVEGGAVLMDIPKLLKFPTFTIRVKADWLGVIVPSGMPKIIDMELKPVKTGGESILTVSVKNIGDGPGVFDTSVSCDLPFRVLESPPTTEVPMGETRNVFVRVYAECEDETIGKCTVTVTDSEDPSKKDTDDITSICKPIVLCYIEGQMRCNGNRIETCEKGKWKLVSPPCEHGCEVVAGKVKCTIPRAVCGNYVCESGENMLNCPSDCLKYRCGNDVCEPGETNANCPEDCKHPCDVTCDFMDINCYNRIINCWIAEIIKSIQLTLVVIGVLLVLGLVAYSIYSARKKPPRPRPYKPYVPPTVEEY